MPIIELNVTLVSSLKVSLSISINIKPSLLKVRNVFNGLDWYNIVRPVQYSPSGLSDYGKCSYMPRVIIMESCDHVVRPPLDASILPGVHL